MVTTTRNPELARGINRYGRAAAARRNGKYLVKNKQAQPKARAAAKPAQQSRWYPTEDVPRPLKARHTRRAPKVRASITPGTVLILLAGRHAGRRVVALGALKSGLIAVTGPFKINGVPLRRVHQRYALSTSTKIDLSKSKLDMSKFTDEYFKAAGAGNDKALTSGEEKAHVPDARRVADQKGVDAAVLKAIGKDAMLRKYLGARFSLNKGQYPHAMKF